jgi:HEAT repeat protein
MRMKLYHAGLLMVGVFLGGAACLGAAEKPSVAELTRELTGEKPAAQRTPEQLEAVYVEVLDALMPNMGDEDPGKRNGPQGILEKIAFRAGRAGAEADRAACAKAIAAKLGRDIGPLGRIWLLKQLERIGRAEAVSQITKLLANQDAQVRESARRALQKNPASEANEALRQALGSAGNMEWRAALINALAERRDPANLNLLMRAAGSQDDGVRIGAVIGLAALEDKSGLAPISAAMSVGAPRARTIAADSYLRLADALVARGDKASALRAFKTMLPAEGYLKCAAIIGIGRAGGPEDLPALLEAAASQDAKLRGACVEALCLLEGKDVARAIAAQVSQSQPETKLVLLQALARRGEKSTVPVFTAATEDADETVRVAALAGLGTVGNPAVVPLLLKAAGTGSKPQQDAARQSLQLLPGADIDKAVLNTMDAGDPRSRAEAARALASRHVVAATPTLLKTAMDADGGVRTESLKALGVVASSEALPALAGLLAKSEDDASRSEAANALVSIANRDDNIEARSEPILKALGASSGDARLWLLRVLGRIGGQQSLGAVRTAVKDNDAKVQDAAIRTLAEWPDATAAADLLGVVNSGANETQQVLAFRGYIRVCRIRTTRQEAETARMLAVGLAAAKRPDQKREALGGLAEVRDILALQAVLPCLDDNAVKEEAASAAARIGREICDQKPEAVKAAMQKVLDISSRDNVKRDAKETLDRAERKLGKS